MRSIPLAVLCIVTLSGGAQADDSGVRDYKPGFTDLSTARPYVRLCEGNGCNAFMPVLKTTDQFRDYKAQQKWGATLGGISGALIGNEVADLPGAAVGALFGAVSGYHYTDRRQWEEDAKEHRDAWERGDDIFYNPAHRLPLEAHWMYAGPPVEHVKK